MDDYFSRARGTGIFHHTRFASGVLLADTPTFMNGVAVPDEVTPRTMFSMGFDMSLLSFPSTYGNFHGIELSAGFRTSPFDLWWSLGTAVTLLNLGSGGPLSIRIGGGFGVGFNLAHAFGYVRGRTAIVLVPRKVDAEISVRWTPPGASSKSYDEQTVRASIWYRLGGSKAALEVFVETYHRLDDGAVRSREIANGMGGGLGISAL